MPSASARLPYRRWWSCRALRGGLGIRNSEANARVEVVNALMDWALPDDPDLRPALERLLEVAVESGAPLIVCVAPMRTDGLPASERIRELAVERLGILGALAREAGVRLALEQVGLSTTRPGAVSGIRGLRDALAIAEAYSEDVALTVDSYNLATVGESFGEIERVPPARIGIAHIVDRDPMTGARVMPGEGDLHRWLCEGTGADAIPWGTFTRDFSVHTVATPTLLRPQGSLVDRADLVEERDSRLSRATCVGLISAPDLRKHGLDMPHSACSGELAVTARQLYESQRPLDAVVLLLGPVSAHP